MARIRTLQLNGELVDHIEMLYKEGRTWNDVVAHILGYEEFLKEMKIYGFVADNGCELKNLTIDQALIMMRG